MGKLNELYDTHGQSPWLDNLKRGWLTSGELKKWVERGVRGVTSNPTIFAKAISGAADYDEQFGTLVRKGTPVEQSYWELVKADIEDALAILRPTYDGCGGNDGFVSIEVAPQLAGDTQGTVESARDLWTAIDEPNLFVKIPGTAEGLPAIQQCLGEGININITLLFGIDRYGEVIDAFFTGLEELDRRGGDITKVSSVASFFVSRVDTEVDRRLETIGSPEALALRGKAAVANAKLAYALFQERFASDRWKALAAKGAAVQRPLWASTSTKNPEYPDTLYIDNLIGPDSVNTMPDQTLEDFEDHGRLERTVDQGLDEARGVFADLAGVGIDMADVTRTLEEEGVASFSKSFDELITTLQTKADQLKG